VFISVPVNWVHVPADDWQRCWRVFEVLELKIEPVRVLCPCQVPNSFVLVAYAKEPGARPPYEEHRFILINDSQELVNAFKALIEMDEQGYSDRETYFMLIEEAKNQVKAMASPFK